MNEFRGIDRTPYLTGSAGFWLPLAQSLVSGFIAFLLVLAASHLAGLHKPGIWALGSGAFVSSLHWFLSLADWRRVVYQLEEFTGVDLDQDHQVGEPLEPVRVEVVEEGGRSESWIDLPCSRDQLAELASGLVAGQSLSEAAWSGGGRPFTRAEFRALVGEMLRRNLAAWNNPKTPARGVTLTPQGRAVMRFLATSAGQSPTLRGRDAQK